jgi:ankyrin repeat protein
MHEEPLPDSIQNNAFFKMVTEHFSDGKWEIVQNENEEPQPPLKRFQFGTEERAYFDWFCAKYGDDVNAVNEDGRTLLLEEVSSWGGIESVKCLVSQGANVNVRDMYGDTPLHLALYRLADLVHDLSKYIDEDDVNRMIQNQIEVIKFLVSAGANVHAKDHSGHTPLERMKAISVGNTEIAAYLSDVSKLYPFSKQFQFTVKEQYEIGKFCMMHGSDVKATDEEGETLLYKAIRLNAYLEVIRFLVFKGADVNVKGKFGSTPLHFAAERWDIEMIKFLVSQGADVKAKDKWGTTPLDWAREAEKEYADYAIRSGFLDDFGYPDDFLYLPTTIIEYLSGIKTQ